MPDPDDDDPEYDGPTQNDKTMGMLAHLLGFFTWVIAPAILLFTHGDKSEFVRRHAKEALNCQVMQAFFATVLALVAGLIGVGVYVATDHGWAGAITGYVLFMLGAVGFGIFELVCIIKASVAASNGRDYRYPLTIRLF